MPRGAQSARSAACDRRAAYQRVAGSQSAFSKRLKLQSTCVRPQSTGTRWFASTERRRGVRVRWSRGVTRRGHVDAMCASSCRSTSELSLPAVLCLLRWTFWRRGKGWHASHNRCSTRAGALQGYTPLVRERKAGASGLKLVNAADFAWSICGRVRQAQARVARLEATGARAWQAGKEKPPLAARATGTQGRTQPPHSNRPGGRQKLHDQQGAVTMSRRLKQGVRA